MFLAPHWRLRFSNFVNQQIDAGHVDVVITRKKLDASGVPVYEDTPLTYTNAGVLAATTGTDVSATFTNGEAGEGWLDADIHIKAQNANAGVGDFVVYYEASPDGTNFPEAGQGRPIYGHRFTASDTDEKVVSIFS